MKTRNGFISNSSSTSFLIEFNHKVDEQFFERHPEIAPIQERIDDIKESIEWMIKYYSEKRKNFNPEEDEDIQRNREYISELEEMKHTHAILNVDYNAEELAHILLKLMIDEKVIKGYDSNWSR